MKDGNDKEVDIASMTITLDFKKKAKAKPKTDRTHNLASNFGKKQISEYNSSIPSLIEKKKQYSMAIREKNSMNNIKKPKDQQLPESDEIKKTSNTETLKSNSFLLNENAPVEAKPGEKEKSLIPRKLGKENDLKSKVRDVKREITKIKKMTAAIEDFKSYGLNNKWAQDEKGFISKHSEFDANISRITKMEDFSMLEPQTPLPPTLAITSQQVAQTIGPFATEEIKEVELLRRQNNTFKKELATFRRENGSLKRQLDEHKKQIQEIKEKNEFLESQNQDNIKLLQSFQMKVGESFQSFALKEEDFPAEPESNMKQILSNYESQLFQATSQVKKLQFRNYMLEKRLLDESEMHKKVMAREISMWKERYIKARNENLRMKDTRNSMLFEMSISEEL